MPHQYTPHSPNGHGATSNGATLTLEHLVDTLQTREDFAMEDYQRVLNALLAKLVLPLDAADGTSPLEQILDEETPQALQVYVRTLLDAGSDAWFAPGSLALFGRYRDNAVLWERLMAKVRDKDLRFRLQRAVDAYLATSHTGRTRAAAVWDKAKRAADFVIEPDKEYECIVRDLVHPESITAISAPYGTGKTMVGYALACAIDAGGVFLGNLVRKSKVLLVDRDNPPELIRKRLRGWGAGQTTDFQIMTRDDAPSLLNRAAWAAFPVERFDVVILDSLGAFTEGVSEREGAETQKYLATLRDLARRGPAVLLLDNTNKVGSSFRGRSEKADTADVFYEARDITGWTPKDPECWWESLPEAGAHAWQQRASRRKGQTVMRMAFVPIKFRFGMDPEPFALELDLRSDPYTVKNVTATLQEEGEDAAEQERVQQKEALEQASRALETALTDRAEPLGKDGAAYLLQKAGLTRQQARNLLESHDGERWTLSLGPGKGSPILVSPLPKSPGEEQGSKKSNVSAAKETPPANPHQTTECAPLISADQQGRGGEKSPPGSPHHHSTSDMPISADGPGSERRKSTPVSPASDTGLEGGVLSPPTQNLLEDLPDSAGGSPPAAEGATPHTHPTIPLCPACRSPENMVQENDGGLVCLTCWLRLPAPPPHTEEST